MSSWLSIESPKTPSSKSHLLTRHHRMPTPNVRSTKSADIGSKSANYLQCSDGLCQDFDASAYQSLIYPTFTHGLRLLDLTSRNREIAGSSPTGLHIICLLPRLHTAQLTIPVCPPQLAQSGKMDGHLTHPTTRFYSSALHCYVCYSSPSSSSSSSPSSPSPTSAPPSAWNGPSSSSLSD